MSERAIFERLLEITARFGRADSLGKYAVDAALIDATPSRGPFAPPEPAYAFDQHIAW